MHLRSRKLPDHQERTCAGRARGGGQIPKPAPSAEPKNVRDLFFALPPELRIHIWSYIVQTPLPIRMIDLITQEHAPRDFSDAHPALQADLYAHSDEMILRHNTVLVNANSNDLATAVDQVPERLIRKIRHLRISRETTAAQALHQRDPERLLYANLDLFDNMMKQRIDSMFFLPSPRNFASLASRWLPNLQTLTLDVGRIDELPEPCWGYAEGWPTWLDESDATRNRRYRGILAEIQIRLPERLASGLRIIVNAKMDPRRNPQPRFIRLGSDRPEMFLRLEYNVANRNHFSIEERWTPWSFCAGHPLRGDHERTDMAGKAGARNISWSVGIEEHSEDTTKPVWRTVEGARVFQSGKLVSSMGAEEEF